MLFSTRKAFRLRPVFKVLPDSTGFYLLIIQWDVSPAFDLHDNILILILGKNKTHDEQDVLRRPK